jgi:hypothetical protein
MFVAIFAQVSEAQLMSISAASDSDDGFDIGCAAPTPPCAAPAESDDPYDMIQPRRQIKKRRRSKPIQIMSDCLMLVFIIIDHSVRFPTELFARLARSIDSPPRYQGRKFLSIIGVAFIQFKFVSSEDAPDDDDFHHLRCDALNERRVKLVKGYVDYRAEYHDRFFLDKPYDIHDRNELIEMQLSSRRWRNELEQSLFGGKTLQQLQDEYDVDPPATGICIAPAHGELFHKHLISALKVVSISARTNPKLLVTDFPRNATLLRWVRSLTPVVDDVQNLESIGDCTLELPASAPANPQSGRRFNQHQAPQLDAVHLLKCMRFSRHLHSQELMGEAIDDAIEAIVDDNSLFEAVYQNKGVVPHKSALRAGRLQLDATAMLLDRRYFKDLITNHWSDVISFHVYTDGSPVTGTELQALILEMFFRDNSMVLKVLPGVGMKTGYGLACKVNAFLWSMYLIIGPWAEGLRLVLSMIKSITTDMGTELGFVDVPDFVDAFLQRLRGRPMDALKVDSATRLFPNALRMAGWSHMFGNLMKHAALSLAEWPRILTGLRALCRFFRVRAWRSTIIRKGAAYIDDIAKTLKNFTAKLLKWRYETLYDVFYQLYFLRNVCALLVNHLFEWFPNFQDGTLIKDVHAACSWSDLLVFTKSNDTTRRRASSASVARGDCRTRASLSKS